MTTQLFVTLMRRFVLACTVILTLGTLMTEGRASAQATMLDFEELPPGTNVTTQYGPRGVLFYNSPIEVNPGAHSGTQVLLSGDPVDEFDTGPLVFTFTSPQSRVELFAGDEDGGAADEGTLRTFDQMGALVAQDGPKPVAGGGTNTLFSVSVPTAQIVRVELQIGSNVFEAIDDLEFEGEPPAPVPDEPPVVEITAPSDGAELDTSTLTIRGTVTGEGLYPTARLQIRYSRRPGSTTPDSIYPVTLVSSGTTYQFTSTMGAIAGPYQVTAYAENIGALSASDRVSFTNLPAAIRARFAAEGGAATFGQLQYSSRQGDCTIAIYENGAIAARPTGTLIVTGAIFDKWSSLPGQSSFLDWPGCPLSEQRSAPGGSLAQPFTGGRIYANLPTGAHYVPAVFAQAIDQLGGESANGVPIADPDSSIGVMQTWLFQQFTRPDHPNLLPSTFEIRGSPPMLWVERQGGDLASTWFDGIPLAESLPTIWEHYPCDDFLGPCTVTPATSAPPIDNAGALYCGNSHYPWGPREWSAVVDDYALTPMLGIVKSSRMSGTDNPLSHECNISQPITNVPDLWRSDWNVDVRPLHPFRNLFADNDDEVEIEFEFCWFQYFFVGVPEWGEPLRGDLLFTSGRWIIDCGHTPYNSEIHPPAVMAYMRTETVNAHRATAARIWVNGIYTGDPVEFDIYPPPRPSPDALLNLRKPVDSQAAYGVNIEYTTIANNRAHIRFTAPIRHVPVSSGLLAENTRQMMWQTGRAYYGHWDLYWTLN